MDCGRRIEVVECTDVFQVVGGLDGAEWSLRGIGNKILTGVGGRFGLRDSGGATNACFRLSLIDLGGGFGV